MLQYATIDDFYSEVSRTIIDTLRLEEDKEPFYIICLKLYAIMDKSETYEDFINQDFTEIKRRIGEMCDGLHISKAKIVDNISLNCIFIGHKKYSMLTAVESKEYCDMLKRANRIWIHVIPENSEFKQIILSDIK